MIRGNTGKLCGFAVLIGGWLAGACLVVAQQGAGSAADPAAGPELDVQRQLASFDQVWKTIADTHWDSSLVGKSWEEARDRLRPDVENAQSIDDVRKAINELLGTLGQSHFGIIPASEYDEVASASAGGGEGTLGMEIRYIDGQLVVSSVRPDFPAASAGIQPGWIVRKIDDRSDDSMVSAARKAADHSVMRIDTVIGLMGDARTSGKPGDAIRLELLDGDDQAHDLTLTLIKAPGQPERLGNLPVITVDYEEQLLEGNIGYLRFNAFIGGPRLARAFASTLESCRDSKGLIIDLRGNRGGLVGLVAGMCGWMAEDRSPIGTMMMSRGVKLKLALNPRQPRFAKPVAVLIDECSISAAEIMAGGMKDLKLAEVFGKVSAGLALPSVVVKLPNGDGFQYAMASYESASGASLEGTGVAPTQPVELSRDALTADPDPVLSAAKKWILGQGSR
jgi:carboxyl-terminal processing protease